MPVAKTFAHTTAAKKIVPIKPISSWSYTRYNDYQTCPLRAKLKHLDKIAEPGGEAMTRGTAVHEAAAAYIVGRTTKLAKELTLFNLDFADLRKAYKRKSEPVLVEDTWAFRADWSRTEWNDWSGCWLRVKLDLAHREPDGTVVVTDWKTGKYSDYKTVEYGEQLELYALSALLMARHHWAVGAGELVVRPRLGWIDEGYYTTAVAEDGTELAYTDADVTALKKTWMTRVRAMLSDTQFAAKPNRTCVWCFYGQSGKAKGGPGICKY